MDKASFFILNIFLNSLLAFLTAVLLIEGMILLFRVRQGRMAALLRMIPILKLPLDLCLYDFSRWSYAQGVNPLHCEEGTRTLSVSCGWTGAAADWLVLPIRSCNQFTVPGDMTFTLADMMGYAIRPSFLQAFALLFTVVSSVFLIRKLIMYYRSIKALNALAKISYQASMKVRNPALATCVHKQRLQILTSPALTGSPFVAGLISSTVYIPGPLSQILSRKEYEAVLAHELEHIRYKDSLVRLILAFITSIFWWIPTKWLHNRIEEGQEIGCDFHCKRYGIHPADLASAICKSAKYTKKASHQPFAHHLSKHAICKRIHNLLQPASRRFRKTRLAFSFLTAAVAFFVVFLGRFWMF